jgi:hypothetical protein
MTDARCVHCGQAHPSTMTFCPETGQRIKPAAPRKPSGPAYAHPRGPPARPAHGPQSSYGGSRAYTPQPPFGQAPSYVQPAAVPYPATSPPGEALPYPQPGPYDQYPQAPPVASSSAPPAYGGPLGSSTLDAGASLAAQATGAGKPVVALLTEAFELYRNHFALFVATAALVIVPLSLVKSAAVALMLAPAATADASTTGLMATALGYLALVFGLAVMSGIAIPLVMGAITIVVADRVTGGQAGPAEAYRLLSRRAGPFLSASIPAFFCVFVGLCLLFIPGLIVGFLFTFLAPVVLLENESGISALTRSVALVKANLLPVAVVCLVFAIFCLVASTITHFLIPRTWFFFDSFVEDVLLLVFVPLPIIAAVLLYLDVRRQADGLDDPGLRADLDALRG